MTKQRKRVWVAIHCEIMQPGKDLVVDEMAAHVSSTLRRAEQHIKNTGVQDFSWWKIQEFWVDKLEGEGKFFFYDHKGKPVKLPAYKRAKANFRKYKKWERLRGK
jgi:hypothetical protein